MSLDDHQRDLRRRTLEGQVSTLRREHEHLEFVKDEKEKTLKVGAPEETERLARIKKEIAEIQSQIRHLFGEP